MKRLVSSTLRTLSKDVTLVVAFASALLGLALLTVSRDLASIDPWQSALLQSLGSNLYFVYFALGFIDYLVKETERRHDRAERQHEAAVRQAIDAAELLAEQERQAAELRFEQARIEAEREFERARIEAERKRVEERWEPVREHVDHYILNIARRCMLAYRIGVGIGDDDLPREQLRAEGVAGLQGTRDWIVDTIIPRLPQLSKRTKGDWHQLLEILDEADQDAEKVIRQFGDRLKPETFAAILETQREIALTKQSCELWAPVLGVPDREVVIDETHHLSTVFRLGVEKHRRQPREVISTLRENAVEDAIDHANALLGDSVQLIDLTIPNFTSERSRLNTVVESE